MWPLTRKRPKERAKGLTAWAGRQIIRYLDQAAGGYRPYLAPPVEILQRTLQPGDVLLVEGDTRVAGIIKYLTQSTWSHAALYVGDALPPDPGTGERLELVEALAEQGVIGVPLAKYARFNTRICRPVGLTDAERRRVVAFALSYLGRQYDTRYILDLVRYLFPYPPVPVALRRRLLALGSGDPTRAICSTMIAQAFHEIGYPILPDSEIHQQLAGGGYTASPYVESEAMHIRTAGLFTPRDFDISPYFAVVKPTLEAGFDFHALAPVERRLPEPDPVLAGAPEDGWG
jgi:hypothetical protein